MFLDHKSGERGGGRHVNPHRRLVAQSDGSYSRATPRLQRPGGNALRALWAPRRFALPSPFLLGPWPLVAALLMHRLHQVRSGYSRGPWITLTS